MSVSPPSPIAGRLVIDVSHWNGIIDWKKVKAAGVTKAIIKLTDGTAVGDPLAGYNFRSGREHGFDVEGYHFLRPNQDRRMQVDIIKAALYGVYATPEETVGIDIEVTGGLSPYYLRQFIVQFYKDLMAATMLLPEFYTRMSLWKAAVGTINWKLLGLPTPDLWAADYGPHRNGCGLTGPRWIGNGWTTFKRWQYSDLGSVDGIAGHVDVNVEP